MDVSSAQLFTLMAQAFDRNPRLLKVNPKILAIVAKLFNKKAIIDRLCDNHQVDIQHTKKTLGWSPKISMIEGIKRTVQLMRLNIKNEQLIFHFNNIVPFIYTLSRISNEANNMNLYYFSMRFSLTLNKE